MRFKKLKSYKKLQAGFTLIEVMIVVAIVGILSAIAYPNYVEYILRAHRADAKTAVLEATQWMERNYSLTQSYLLQGNGTAITSAVLGAQGFGTIPRGSTAGDTRYTLSFSVGPAQNQYTIQAVPQGAQVADTNCATLRATNLLVKTATGTLGNASCWAR